MERLMQKYIKYFYITLLILILVQFVGITIETILSGFQCGTIISLMLFLINVILLIDAIKHNVRQQFTECKEDARILRFTLALLAVLRILSYSCEGFDWIRFTDYVMLISVIEIILAHRIKSIEHLESLASKINRTYAPDQKGEE